MYDRRTATTSTKRRSSVGWYDGIKKTTWKDISEKVSLEGKTLDEVKNYFNEVIGSEATDKDIIHIYKRLLQSKFNHKGERVLIKGDLIYCDDLEYGQGLVDTIFDNSTLILVKFISRPFPTMCDKSLMTTVHEDIKRKIILKGNK